MASGEPERGASGPGKAGCPGAESDGDRNLLEPGTAAQRPFGDDAGGGRNRQRGQDRVSPPAHERGAALVVTLIFVTAMAAAAVAFLAGRRTDALTLRGQLQAVEAQAMLDAALQQTVVLLANRKPRQVVPAQLSWRFGEVAVQVRFEQETGKIDLNAAGEPAAACPAAGARPRRGPRRRAGGRDPGLARRQSAQARARCRGPRLSRRVARGRRVQRTGRSPTPPSCSTCRRSTLPCGRCSSPVTVYSGAAAPDARQAAGPVRQAMRDRARPAEGRAERTGTKPASDDATGDGAGGQLARRPAPARSGTRGGGWRARREWRAPCRGAMTVPA